MARVKLEHIIMWFVESGLEWLDIFLIFFFKSFKPTINKSHDPCSSWWFQSLPPRLSPSTTTGNSWFQQTSTGSNNIGMWSIDEEAGEGRTMKTGPRWVFFFSFLFFFSIFHILLAYLLIFYGIYRILFTKYMTGRATEGDDDQNRPRWCWMRRLGTRWVILFFSLYFLLLTKIL